MATKSKLEYACTECGWQTSKWVGRCAECQSWGTVVETSAPRGIQHVPKTLMPGAIAQPITEVSTQASVKIPTGVSELDRVLGGGLVPGVVVLLAGEPGIGKSTLLLDVAAKAAQRSHSTGLSDVLYVTGEESASQVRSRAERIGALDDHLLLAAEPNVQRILGHIQEVKPSLLVLDSIQTIADPEVEGAAGGVAQVRAVTSAVINSAKMLGMPVIIVGHVTKDGSIAGPRTLEHLVDVVCQFEGDRHSRLRLIRATKNRYGATDEVGCFELTDSGIHGLEDPSGLFLSSRTSSVPGTCVSVTLEGRRPMPVEIQALSVIAPGPPRRTTAGVDYSRVAMMLAVLQSRMGIRFEKQDIFVSTIGGARAMEPTIDCAIALSLTSAALNLPVAPSIIALGEVSLTGELRPVVDLQQRINEAARLGFRIAIVPQVGEVSQSNTSIDIRRAADVRAAAQLALPIDV